MLTLYVVRDLRERLLRSQLNLVSDDAAGGGSPVRGQTVVASNPLGADVGVNLDRVRFTIVGSCGQNEVREGQRLFDEIGRLSAEPLGLFDVENVRCHTSTGLKNLTVRSTGPAVITNVL